jgi:hypothetical protein
MSPIIRSGRSPGQGSRATRLRVPKPSPSMAVALVALMFALAGTATATLRVFSGDKIIAKHSLSGNRLRDHTITGHEVNLSQLGKVPSASTADTAARAGSATLATDATQLDGISGSDYARRDCNSDTGQIKGYAEVATGSSTPSTFTDVPGAYNCSGRPVEVRRLSTGVYELKFLDSPVTTPFGNAYTTLPVVAEGYVVEFVIEGPGAFQVRTAVGTTLADISFTVIAV